MQPFNYCNNNYRCDLCGICQNEHNCRGVYFACVTKGGRGFSKMSTNNTLDGPQLCFTQC